MTIKKAKAIAAEFNAAVDTVLERKRREEAAAKRENARLESERKKAAVRQEKSSHAAQTRHDAEFGILLDALESLPEKNGKSFTIRDEQTWGFNDGSYSIRFYPSYGNIKFGWSSLYILVENNIDDNPATVAKRFAEARKKIGAWVAEQAPERMEELKAALRKQTAPKAPSGKGKPKSPGR